MGPKHRVIKTPQINTMKHSLKKKCIRTKQKSVLLLPYFLAKLGADVAGSPAEVASQVNRVVTMLPENSHVQHVLSLTLFSCYIRS